MQTSEPDCHRSLRNKNTLADLVNESKSIIGLKKDSDIVDDTTQQGVNAVQRDNQRKKNRNE